MLGRAAAAAALTGLADRYTNTQRRRRKRRKKVKKKKKVLRKSGKKELVRRVTRTRLNSHKDRIRLRFGGESLPLSGDKNTEKKKKKQNKKILQKNNYT